MDLNIASVDAKYRPAPFWSWNDKLEISELRRQIREMHRVGLGGFFMHARGGLQTEYLSEEWMDCVKACLDEAQKCGMNAWLYDENGWPSGFGGGLVNGLGLKYQQKYLRHEITDAAEASKKENTIAFYTEDGGCLLGRQLPAGTSGKVLRCFFEVNPYYVDNLDAGVVAEFLRVTHQRYYETLPAELRKNLRGIFTDEPQLSRNGLLWSFVLEEEYRKAYGRELLPELPMLFLNLPGHAAVRIRFWNLCARLFTEHFMKQIRDWCDAHNWEITGHHVLEETCQSQISSNGSVMAQYRYYNMPGMDHLGRSQASPVTQIQLVSSAAQFGQKQILTESFAMTGWACHFSGMRWIYLPQLARGINFLCPHLESYTLRGLRKRDYPASAFCHEPWWDDYGVFNDAVSRIGMILSEGTANTEVLVIHPLSSAWKVYTGDERDPLLDQYTKSLNRTTAALDNRLIPHHYADEIIVDEVGSVDGKAFRIGKCSYSCVIVPQLSNLSGKIAKLLREFAGNGGTVLVVRNQNEDGVLTIDGEPASREFTDWFGSLPSFGSEEPAAEQAMKFIPDRIKITENGVMAEGIVGTMRDVSLNGRKGRFCYLVNSSYRKPSHLSIILPKAGEEVELLDPVTGKLSVLDGVTETADGFTFDFTLAAAGDAAFFITEKSSLPHTSLMDPNAGQGIHPLKNEFTLREYSCNLLTLDRCRYRVDGGEWSACDIIDLQARLLARQQDCDLDMEIEFFCDDDFDFKVPLKLAVETPEKFKFALNGKSFAVRECGYLFDKAFRLIELPNECKSGRNVIALSIRYTQPASVYAAVEAAKVFESEYNKLTFETELESVYLCGDFTVRHSGGCEKLRRNASRFLGSFSLGAPLAGKVVYADDLLRSGLPFFCGNLTLTQSFSMTEEEARKAKFLRMELYGANSCKVKINGRDLGGCFCEPYAVPVEGALKPGENTVELELVTSLRNMLGPHHLQIGEDYAVHTLSFNREPNVIGRMPPPYHPGYCFAEFGVISPELA